MASFDQRIQEAVRQMLAAYGPTTWVCAENWPENADRLRGMLRDLWTCVPPGRDRRVLDVGCFVGRTTLLMHLLGYRPTGADAADYPERAGVFARHGIEFVACNLNALRPLEALPDASFDFVWMGEVFEHVFNHPLGLLREGARVLKPGGWLALSTPNPSTLVNGLRIMCNRGSLWGTRDFITLPKFTDQGGLACKPDIHYREYTSEEMRFALAEAGLTVREVRYLGMGIGPRQSPWKRAFKRLPPVRWLMSRRPFACTHYFLAAKPAPGA